jgi:hypothetical protein
VHFNLANAYFLKGQTRESIPYYERSCELQSNKAESHYNNLSNAYCTLKEY